MKLWGRIIRGSVTPLPGCGDSLRRANEQWGGVGSPFARALDGFDAFWAELNAHLSAEMTQVFPVVRALVSHGDRPMAARPVLPAVLRMEGEHDCVHAALTHVRRLCAACPVAPPAPEWQVCARDVRRLGDAIEDLLMMENGVLFPRAIALEYAGGVPGGGIHARRVA